MGGDSRGHMRAHAKQRQAEHRAKKVPAKGGHVPPALCPAPPYIALDPLVVMAVIRNNE